MSDFLPLESTVSCGCFSPVDLSPFVFGIVFKVTSIVVSFEEYDGLFWFCRGILRLVVDCFNGFCLGYVGITGVLALVG